MQFTSALPTTTPSAAWATVFLGISNRFLIQWMNTWLSFP